MSSEKKKKSERMNQKQKEIMKIECIYWKTKRMSTIECKGRKKFTNMHTLKMRLGWKFIFLQRKKYPYIKFTLVLGLYIFFLYLTFNQQRRNCHSMDQLYLNLPHLLASSSVLQIPFFIHITFSFNSWLQT